MMAYVVAAVTASRADREFAVADARGEAFDEFRHRILAIGADQFGECRKQAGLRQAIAVDAVVTRFRPGLVEIAERRLLLFVVGQRVAGGSVMKLNGS